MALLLLLVGVSLYWKLASHLDVIIRSFREELWGIREKQLSQ
jgi:hypothetical protein